MQLRDLMTRGVEEIPPQATLREAAQKMKSLDIGALPVCENDKLVGMITDRDIAVRAVAAGQDPNRATVRDAMTEQLFYCYEDEDVEKAAKLMEEKQVRRLPVFDHQMRVCGIISLGDIATRAHDDRLSGEVLEQVSEPKITHA
jgi:CBS domain-containing protein